MTLCCPTRPLSGNPVSPLMAVVVSEIIDWVERHLHHPLRVSQLARKAGYSPWHFQRGFRAVTGLSVGRYLRLRKMSVAASLLTMTRLPVTDIHTLLGYEDTSSFYRVFRTVARQAPQHFRDRTASLPVMPDVLRGLPAIPPDLLARLPVGRERAER